MLNKIKNTWGTLATGTTYTALVMLASTKGVDLNVYKELIENGYVQLSLVVVAARQAYAMFSERFKAFRGE